MPETTTSKSIDSNDLERLADRALRRGRHNEVSGAVMRELEYARDQFIESGTEGVAGLLRRRRLQKWINRVERPIQGGFREVSDTLIYALSVAIVIRIFLVQAFQIPTGSMERTLLIGDYLLVNKFLYGPKTPDRIIGTDISLPAVRFPGFRRPRPGDIIVFAFPGDVTQDYIKRCVAVEGQKVEMRQKRLYVDGVLQDEPYVHFADAAVRPARKEDQNPMSRADLYRTWSKQMAETGPWNRDNFGPVVVPEGHLLMFGDNRDRSSDGRYWGFLDEDLIRGKAVIIYWSRNREEPIWSPLKGYRWGRIGQFIH